jgi:hypothetical protein
MKFNRKVRRGPQRAAKEIPLRPFALHCVLCGLRKGIKDFLSRISCPGIFLYFILANAFHQSHADQLI